MPLKLKYSDTPRPTAALHRQRTPREILLAALDEQIALADATLEGREFKVSKERYKKIDGVRKKVTVEASPRPWWFETNGQVFGEIRYGTTPLDLSERGMTTFEIGTKLEEVPKVFRQIREAVAGGECDAAIEAAKAKASRRAA